MPNGNGQGPQGLGSKSGRGRGFCSGSGMAGSSDREIVQDKVVETQVPATGCRGPRGCGNGMKKSGEARRGNSGNGRGQR